MGTPANHGKPWTMNDELLLMKMVDVEKKTNEQVANKLQRTEMGISVR